MTEFMGYVSSFFVTFLQLTGFVLCAILFGLLLAYGFRAAYRGLKNYFIEQKPLPVRDLKVTRRYLRHLRRRRMSEPH